MSLYTARPQYSGTPASLTGGLNGMSHEKYCVLAGVTLGSVCTQGVETLAPFTTASARAFATGTTSSLLVSAPTFPSHVLSATPSGKADPLGSVVSTTPVMSLKYGSSLPVGPTPFQSATFANCGKAVPGVVL